MPFVSFQLRAYGAKHNVFNKTLSEDSIVYFTWTKAVTHASFNMPHTMTIVKGTLTKVDKINTQQVKGRKGAKRWVKGS